MAAETRSPPKDVHVAPVFLGLVGIFAVIGLFMPVYTSYTGPRDQGPGAASGTNYGVFGSAGFSPGFAGETRPYGEGRCQVLAVPMTLLGADLVALSASCFALAAAGLRDRGISKVGRRLGLLVALLVVVIPLSFMYMLPNAFTVCSTGPAESSDGPASSFDGDREVSPLCFPGTCGPYLRHWGPAFSWWLALLGGAFFAMVIVGTVLTGNARRQYAIASRAPPAETADAGLPPPTPEGVEGRWRGFENRETPRGERTAVLRCASCKGALPSGARTCPTCGAALH